jgi:serine/threonine protein kinase
LSGDLIEQMYNKLREIGQGSYGIVYKAQNTSNKNIVALKRIKLTSPEEGIPASAIREIALLKELEHPNILRLYDVLHSRHKLTLVFEYCEYDLSRYIENSLLNSIDQIISFSKQILSALEFMHKKNIIHRDVKPHNLLYNKKNEIKLADFGFRRSTFIPVDSMSSEVITQYYRPPEILLGSTNYSYPVDVWSAGCVIAKMILKKPLFLATIIKNNFN